MKAGPRWLAFPLDAFDTALALATLWLTEEGLPPQDIYCLDAGMGSRRDSGLYQFVTADGQLEHNAWLWLERAGVTVTHQPHPVTFAGLASLPASAVVLVPEGEDTLLSPTHAECVADLEDETPDHWRLVDRASGEVLLRASRDAFGRIVRVSTDAQGSGQKIVACASPAIRVVIAGEREHLYRRYPGVLAALGDTVDALDLVVEVKVRSPRELGAQGAAALMAECDALILPGGCDNSQVEGMIELAGRALAQDVPTLGLCFGMQAMVTAAIRASLGVADAALQEVEPDAADLAIIGMPGRGADLRHRLGEQTSQVLSGTRLAEIHGLSEIRERMNHRYRLAERWEAPLADAGIVVSARSCDGAEIADAIEATDRHFYVGYQGHPELSSRPQRPHPAFVALLNEARNTSPHHVFDRKDR